MQLIIGGAYQGKRDYAKSKYQLSESHIFTCKGTQIDFSYPCIDSLEEFTLACIQEGSDPKAYMIAHREEWKNSILICQDIFCGVVPMDAQMRLWRNVTGTLCQYLTQEAQQVTRIFCGLEQILK